MTLQLNVEGPTDELEALSERVKAKRSGGTLAVSFETSEVSKAIEMVRSVSEAFRAAEKNPKGFK